MRIAIGSDHGGFELKPRLIRQLRALRHRVTDLGAFSPEPCDYPGVGAAVAQAVSRGRAQRGVLLCKSGGGMAIVANRFPRVRAVVCQSSAAARHAREHNDCNLLVLGAEGLPGAQARWILSAWLKTPFAGGRHARRVRQIGRIERVLLKGCAAFLLLACLIPAAEAVRVQSHSLEEAFSSDTVVLAARVAKRQTSVTEVDNDGADARLLSPKLYRMTSRYEVERVRFLRGPARGKLKTLEFTELADPRVSYSTAASGLEHTTREGEEYLFLARPPLPKRGGVLQVFRVESMDREPELLRMIRGHARASEGR